MLDGYFKRYFWTFHLVVLAAAALLVARAVNAFVADALLTPPEALASAPAGKEAPARPAETPAADIDAFQEKNIFRAAREDLAAAAAAAAAAEPQDSGSFDPNNCEPAAMQADLIATMVSPEEDQSIAVFEERQKKEQFFLRMGEKLLGEAEVMIVDYLQVKVRHNGRCELFAMEEGGEKASGAVASAAPPPPAEGGGTDGPPIETDLGKGVKKVSESEYEIPRSDIEGVLSNLNAVATQARIVPSFNNGKANGFKLFSIRPGSLYSKIGIQNGDIVQRINGYEMNSPDKALEIYSKLKDASSITVDLIRRGKSQTLSYSIR